MAAVTKRERGKKPKKPEKSAQLWKLYGAKGDKLERKNKFCPKCGAGFFLATHKDRLTCGNCGYTEFTGKKAAEQKKEAKEEPKSKEEKQPEPKKETKEVVKKEEKAEK